ncbi:hypothetical protein ACFLIM_37355 [Nonomuraea sp. M3C6]|uniref:Uncharacterized protein n=1 Tax=Nonomuraea marmarensis TaxID=3351344 RepID=A0ABW7AR50_9ACTN
MTTPGEHGHEAEGPDTTMTVLPYVLAAACGAVAHRDWEHTVLRTLLLGTARAGRTLAETEIIIDGESSYLDAALDTYRPATGPAP